MTSAMVIDHDSDTQKKRALAPVVASVNDREQRAAAQTVGVWLCFTNSEEL